VQTEIFTNTDIDVALTNERPHIVRFCTYLVRDSSVAEDLAQETLLIAWRLWPTMSNPAGITAWLFGIARNVCHRWQRSQARESNRISQLDGEHEEILFAHDEDFTLELEHHELAALLDRALGLLPPETRIALVEHYVEGSPYAEIAARLGVSDGTVAVRVHRGKIAFRKLLQGTLRAEAEALGIIMSDSSSAWAETRIWCPECGKQHLLGMLDAKQGNFSLRCPACSHAPRLEITKLPITVFWIGRISIIAKH
jgi:RNA polymerase sigma factor (sigma-70 family)